MCIIETTGIAHDGAAVGRVAGRVYFVEGALPGETVKINPDPIKSKQRHTATLEAVIKPHAQRRIPPCSQAGICGGCALQIADENLQSTLKTRIVADAMKRIGHIEVAVDKMPVVEKAFRYRNKGLFHVSHHSGRVQLGFYAKASHDLIPAGKCLLFSENVNALVTWLEDWLSANDDFKHIKKIMIRESSSSGELMVIFITQTKALGMTAWVNALEKTWPLVTSVWHNVNPNPRLMLGEELYHLAGEPTIPDAIGKLKCRISPASFLQINNEQAAKLYETARNLSRLQPQDTLLDLYCGAGTIGLYMADTVRQVIGVESNPAAVKDARANAWQAGADNISFYNDKAELWLPKWRNQGGQADIAILDPPRKGLDGRLIESLVQAEINRITYISCNPATCARDLAIFQKNGYQINKIQPIDLFPQTSHVETVVLMSRVDE